MARLIDADALIIHFNDWALSASPTGRESVKESTLMMREYNAIQTAIEGIAHAPTVDAIPVEWLREKMKTPTMTCANPFDYVFCEWMNEQETRDG